MICAFDIGGTKVDAATVDRDGRLTMIGRLPTPVDDYDLFVSSIVSLVPPEASAVGLSLAAVMDNSGVVAACANIPCLRGRHLEADLAIRLGRTVLAINDADAFGLAQAVSGIGAGHRLVFAIILGTGVGGTVVLDGEILGGGRKAVGEWGHSPAAAIGLDGPLPRLQCGCGQIGCVDTLGGARGLERLHRHLHEKSPISSEILTAWAAQDAEATATVELFLDVVSGALACAVNVLAPTIVPVGGGLAGDASLIAALDRQVRARSVERAPGQLLFPVKAGVDQGLMGAAIHVKRYLDAHQS